MGQISMEIISTPGSTLSENQHQQHFNVGEMKKLKLPVPTLARQDRVIAILDAAWQVVRVEEAQLATLQSTKAALMSDLLSGRVRVAA